MKKTIIFLSGFLVPKWISKSMFVWDNYYWKDYRKIYLSSKIPTSDRMVDKELKRLSYLTNVFPNVTVAGHSLGAWWAANLACEASAKIKKLVFWTPLTNINQYPIFNVSSKHNPLNKIPNVNNVGIDKSLVVYGNKDLIVPAENHSTSLTNHFQAMSYQLLGGHFHQSNHKSAILYMRDWVELF